MGYGIWDDRMPFLHKMVILMMYGRLRDSGNWLVLVLHLPYLGIIGGLDCIGIFRGLRSRYR